MREKMKVQDYINRVVMPISDEAAKNETALEIRAHLEERIEFYKEIGYDDETAEEKAVEDMGDPEPVGASLSKLHPKGRVITAVLAVLPMLLLGAVVWFAWFFSVDDRLMGTGFLETLWFGGLLGLSHMGKRRNSRVLCAIPLVLFCTVGWWIWGLIFFEETILCSPSILIAACLLTGDMECLYTFSQVGGVTVAPWLTGLTYAFYVLLFALLLAMLISVCRVDTDKYSRFEKQANRRIGVAQRSVQLAMAGLFAISVALPALMGGQVKLPVAAEPEDFNTIVIAQSDTPCAVEDIPVEDLLIFDANYDWSKYLLSWDKVYFDTSDDEISGNPEEEKPIEKETDHVAMSCGSKLQYVVGVTTIHFDSTKAYTYVGFVQRDLFLQNDEPALYVTITPADWQKTEDVGTVQAAMNYYDCVEVVVNDARE